MLKIPNKIGKPGEIKKLIEAKLPISPSLGSLIDSLGRGHFESWADKVSVQFQNKYRTVQSINSSWEVLINLCDCNSLYEFELLYLDKIIDVSLYESVLLTEYAKDIPTSTIGNLIDDDLSYLT